MQELPGAAFGERSVVPSVRDPAAAFTSAGAVAAGSRRPVAGLHGRSRPLDGGAAEASVLHRSSPSQ